MGEPIRITGGEPSPTLEEEEGELLEDETED